jgi:hypothetical protein
MTKGQQPSSFKILHEQSAKCAKKKSRRTKMETAKRVKTDTLKKDLIDNLPEGCSLKTANSEANETQEHTQTVS